MNVTKILPVIFDQDNDRQCFGFFMCATQYFKAIGAQGITCSLREYRVMYMGPVHFCLSFFLILGWASRRTANSAEAFFLSSRQ